MEGERQPSPVSSPEASSLGDAIPLSPAAESALVPAGTSNDAAAPVPDSPPHDTLWERPFLLSALTLGAFWAIESTDYEHTQWWTAGLLLAAVLIGAALLRGVRFAPWLVLGHAVAVGFADRVVRSPVGGSDVILVTKEAIGVLARGENPYTHYYETTIPPGSPFAYLPGELLFHAIPNAIFGGIDRVNQWAGIGTVLLLAALAPLVGPGRAALATALYGTFGLAAYRAMDGSNDTGLGFLLVLATVLLAWSERPSRVARILFYASAATFGWALGYKQFAALIYPFVLLYLRRRGAAWRGHGAIAVGLPLVATLPFLLLSPAALLSATTAGLTWHTNVWGLNLWAGLRPLAPGLVDAVSPALNVLTPLALLAIALALAVRPAASLGTALLQGLGLLFAALFLARWTTSPYYTGAGGLLAAAVALTPARLEGPPMAGAPVNNGLPLPQSLVTVISHHAEMYRHRFQARRQTSLAAPEVAAPPMTAEARHDTEWERPLLLTALTLGVFWAIESTDFDHIRWWTAGLLLAAVLVGVALVRGARIAPWLVLAHAVAVGIADRVVRVPLGSSDVLPATKEAIGVIARGGNPYSHVFEHTAPAGAPFGYPPGEIAFYAIPNAIFGGISQVDKWAGIGMLLLMAGLWPLIGIGRAALATALYATFGLAAFRAMDGSNDTSLAFLLVLATVLLAWSERPGSRARWFFYGSAIIFGWSMLFKQLAVLVYPFVALYLRRCGLAWQRHATIVVGLAVLVSLPFFVTAPVDFARQMARVGAHDNVWGLNLWAASRSTAPGFIDAIDPAIPFVGLAAMVATGWWLFRHPAPTLSVAIFQGLTLLFVTFFLANWTTSSYYTGAGALLAAAVALAPATLRTSLAWSTTASPLPSTMAFDGHALPSGAPPRGLTRPLSDAWQRWGWRPPHRPGADPERVSTVPSRRAQSMRVVAPLLLAAMLAGGILRFEGLSGLPAGLNQDEAVNGYDAYSLIHTGRDHHGHPFPFAGLESFGDWASPLLTFLTAPVVGIFGLKLQVIRAVSAAVGLAAIPIVYWLAVELFGRRSIGIAAAWLIALSPWAIHLSRWAIPPTIVPTMVAATMLAIVWTARRRSGHGLLVAATLAGLTMASYPTMKLFIPLVGLVAILVYGRDLLRIDRGSIVGAALILLAIAGPVLFLSTVDPGGRARLDQVSAFHDGPDIGLFTRQYRSYFSPHFLFYRGDGDAMHLPTGYGVELRSTIPILLWGLVWLVVMALRPLLARWRSALFLLGVLVVYPVPGSLTVPSPHTLRAAQLIPLTALIGAVGVVTGAELIMRLIRRAQPASARGALAVIWTLPLLLFFGTEVVSRSQQYHDQYPDDTAYLYQDGLVPALTFAREHAAGVDEIWVADVNQPYIYVLFEAQWSPSDVHDHLQLQRDPPRFNNVQGIGKYHFPDSFGGDLPPEIQAAMDTNSLTPLFEDHYPQGSPAYQVREGDVPGHGRILVVDRI